MSINKHQWQYYTVSGVTSDPAIQGQAYSGPKIMALFFLENNFNIFSINQKRSWDFVKFLKIIFYSEARDTFLNPLMGWEVKMSQYFFSSTSNQGVDSWPLEDWPF